MGVWKKSDQGGIEISNIVEINYEQNREEIRPRWDWNFWEGFARLTLSQRKKSDQGGIEILRRTSLRFSASSKKSDQGGIEIMLGMS